MEQHEGSIESEPFAIEHAAVVASWPNDADEARSWAGVATPFPVDPARIQTWHDDPDVTPYVGRLRGELVAYGEIWRDGDAGDRELARIIVRPGRRGVGIGRAFARALAEQVATSGAGGIFVRVTPRNLQAVHCYLAAGFVAIPEVDRNRFNVGQPVAYRWFRYEART